MFIFFSGNIHIPILRMDVVPQELCVVCARVVMAVNVTPSSDSLTLWYPGAYHTLVTDTTTGLVCMADWSGMDSSLPQ